VGQQREDTEHHDRDLEGFGDLEDPGLAEAIRDLAGGAREQQEGDHEHRACQRRVARPDVLIESQVDRHDGDEHLIYVVVERGEKLGPQERAEPAIAEQFRVRARWGRERPGLRGRSRRRTAVDCNRRLSVCQTIHASK